MYFLLFITNWNVCILMQVRINDIIITIIIIIKNLLRLPLTPIPTPLNIMYVYQHKPIF